MTDTKKCELPLLVKELDHFIKRDDYLTLMQSYEKQNAKIYVTPHGLEIEHNNRKSFIGIYAEEDYYYWIVKPSGNNNYETITPLKYGKIEKFIDEIINSGK